MMPTSADVLAAIKFIMMRQPHVLLDAAVIDTHGHFARDVTRITIEIANEVIENATPQWCECGRPGYAQRHAMVRPDPDEVREPCKPGNHYRSGQPAAFACEGDYQCRDPDAECTLGCVK